MARKAAASLLGWLATGNRAAGKTVYDMRWPFSVNRYVVAVAVMALPVAVAVGVAHKATMTGHAPDAVRTRPAAASKPAFTRAEGIYIQALWPIHGEVERSSLRMSLGKIFYTTNDLGKADLKARADTALATYRQAEARISTLQPPSSLAAAHDDYLAAVRLFEQSAVEVMKMFDDGNDGHLLAAFPLSQQGSNKIREVGARFWQDEFPPN